MKATPTWCSFYEPQNWSNFADLLNAGIRGVDQGRGDDPRPLIMIHIDRGGDRERTQTFFDNCAKHGVQFDVIGQSYYPWWHGGLDDLRINGVSRKILTHGYLMLTP